MKNLIIKIILISFFFIISKAYSIEYEEIILEKTKEFIENKDADKIAVNIDINPVAVTGNSTIQNIEIFIENEKNSSISPFFNSSTSELEFILQKYNQNKENTLPFLIKSIQNNEIPFTDIEKLYKPLIYTGKNAPYFLTYKFLSETNTFKLENLDDYVDISMNYLYSGMKTFKKSFLTKKFLDDDFMGNFDLEKFIINISQRNSIQTVKDGFYLKGYLDKNYFYPEFLQKDNIQCGIIAINIDAFQKQSQGNFFNNNYLCSDYFNFSKTDFTKLNSNDIFNLSFIVDISKARSSLREGNIGIRCLITTSEGEKIYKDYKIVYNKGMKGTILDNIKDAIIVSPELSASSPIYFDYSYDTYSGFDNSENIVHSNFTSNNSKNLKNNNNLFNYFIENKNINNKDFNIFIKNPILSNNINSYIFDLGTVYFYENNIQNIRFNIKSRKNNNLDWFENDNSYLYFDKDIFQNIHYDINELEVDIFLDNSEYPEKTIRILMIFIKDNNIISPVLNTYSPKYFKKYKEKNQNIDNLISGENGEKESNSYYYYGIKKNYFPDYSTSTICNTENILKLNTGYEYTSDNFGNIDNINKNQNILTLKNCGTNYRLSFEEFNEYEKNQNNFVNTNFIFLSSLQNISFSYTQTEEDIDLINENIKKINNLNDSNRNFYNFIHTFQDFKYQTGIDNNFTLNNFKIFLESSKDIYFMSNSKKIPVFIQDFDTENIISSFKNIKNSFDFDNFGNKSKFYPTKIEEYIFNNNNDTYTRKFFIKNTAILDRYNNYIPFTSLYDSKNAEINVNISLYWNYISPSEEIFIKNNDLFLNFKPLSEYKLLYQEYSEEGKANVYNNINIFERLNFEFENYHNSTITDAEYIRNLYNDEIFNPDTNNAYEITDDVSDNSLLINPDFFSRLGKIYELKSFFKKSNIENENALNYFFMLPSNEKIKISLNKNNLLNTENIEFPGEEYAKDTDPKFILSDSNYNLFRYFSPSKNQDIFENYNKIESEIFYPQSYVENFGKKYIFNDNNIKIEQDEVYVDSILFSSSSALYFSNNFQTDINNMLVSENTDLYSKYRLSKSISGNLIDSPSLLSHLEYISPDFDSPEEIYINLNLNGVNATENRVKKVLSCNYDNVSANDSVSKLNKFEIKYNIVKFLPNITNIYQVFDENVKKISTENISGSNIKQTDIYENSMIELSMHGRIYDDSAVYLCSDSSSKFYMKIDHFNIDSLSESFKNIENYNVEDSLKYFSDADFENTEIFNPILNEDIQKLYEDSSALQDKKSFFIIDKLTENKFNNQISFLQEEKKDSIKEALLYYENKELMIPFSVIFVNKSSLKYEKYNIKNSFSSVNELNKDIITHILTINGNFYKISPIENENSSTFYNEDGTKITENISMFLNLDKIPDSLLSFEKLSPIDYILDFETYFFNSKSKGKKDNKKFNLSSNDNSSLFSFLELKDHSPFNSKNTENIFLNKIYSYKKNYKDDLNFSSTGIDFQSESLIENSFNSDFYKMFPADRYSFFTSCNRFIANLPNIFMENKFIRSLPENKFSLNIIPIEKISTQNILNPDKFEFEYLNPDLSNKFYETIYNSLEFLNKNLYSKDFEENILNLKNNESLFTFPDLKTSIISKNNIALKDKFDIEISCDFREDYLNNFEEKKELLNIFNINGKNKDNKFYFNGKEYDVFNNNIEYTYNLYQIQEQPSYKKELLNGIIKDSYLYSFFDYTDSFYKKIYPEIYPLIYLKEFQVNRVKKTKENELFFKINFYENEKSNLDTIYLKNNEGIVKSDAEIIKLLNNIEGLTDNFEEIEVKRVFSSRSNEEFIYSFKIKGIKFNSKIYCEYFDIYGNSILSLNDIAKKNKKYELVSENNKKITTTIRKSERR